MIKKIFPLLILLIPTTVASFTLENELFSEAESRYYSKTYAVALETYNEFIEKFPLSDLIPDAQYRSAVCLFRLERYMEAYALFEAIEKRYRTTRYIEYVPFWKGVTAFYLKDYRPAKEYFEIFLTKSKDVDFIQKALLYKSLIEVSLKSYSSARKTINRLVKDKGYSNLSSYEAVLYSYILLKEQEYDSLINFQDKIDLDSLEDVWKEKFLLYKAEAYWGKGAFGEASKIYKNLLDASNEIATTAYRRLYTIAQQRNDFSEMERIIQKAEVRFEKTQNLLDDLWVRIGIESYNREELDLAEHFFKKVWNLENYEEMTEIAPLYLAQINKQNENIDEARKILEDYLNFSGKEPGTVVLRLCNLYLQEKNYSEASKRLLQFIEKPQGKEHLNEASYLLAYSQYKLGNLETALSYCSSLLDEGIEWPRMRDIFRLKTIILAKMDKEEAYTSLIEYTKRYPDEIRARLDLLKILFSMREYKKVISESSNLRQSVQDLSERDPFAYVLTNYLLGLSQISLKLYEDALHTLSEITKDKLTSVGLLIILPYTEYYRGWVHYRLNNLKQAAELYDSFIQSYKDHDLTPNALYNGAWCYFSMGEYAKAQSLFSELAKIKKGTLSVKALFLEGKCLNNLKKRDEALTIFQRLSNEHPDSPYSDDALFEYANILGDMGKIKEAASGYQRLFDKYPKSPLAPEALYKKGEILFSNEQYEEAKTSFSEYRNNYPEGKLIDASLYWEGLSAYRLGNEHGATLLWEIIINTYKESPFRADALRQSAEVYVSFGEYRRALDLYTILIDTYPDYGGAADVNLRAEEIRYLIFGLGKKEAELTAIISRNRGVKTIEGRKAMLELSRIYIFENEKKLERAFQMLGQVMLEDDPATNAEAQFLLGEYYFKSGDFVKAGEEFFNASLKRPQDRDFMAYSIYRAAQMMKLAGRRREMEELVGRLQKNFPQSEWSFEGQRLLESIQ